MRGRLDVLAPICDLELLGCLAAGIEHVPRDVGEDNFPSTTPEGTEADPSFASADIQQPLVLLEGGFVEHLVPDLDKLVHELASKVRV